MSFPWFQQQQQKQNNPPSPRTQESSNSKTLFYKDCSLDSVKNMSNN